MGRLTCPLTDCQRTLQFLQYLPTYSTLSAHLHTRPPTANNRYHPAPRATPHHVAPLVHLQVLARQGQCPRYPYSALHVSSRPPATYLIVLTCSDAAPPRQTRGARLLSKLTGRGRPTPPTGHVQRSPAPFVVGGARIDPNTQPKSTGPYIVGGRRVEPATQPRKPTGPAFVVGGARIEPSSRPKSSGPFVVGGPRVEPR